MAQFKLASWNVNGIRAAAGKGFFDWLKTESPDIACIQETKAQPAQLGKEFFVAEDKTGQQYYVHWASAQKKGYSGVAIYSKEEPKSITQLGIDDFDNEGRYLEADFGSIVVVSAYFPNSQEAGARIDYKLAFCDAILGRMDALVKAGRDIVLCGDYNIAHKAIDLAHPKANEGNPGYLPEERAWMDKFLSCGYIDTFRHQHPDEPEHYSWWSYRLRARDRNVGWRLDYHCINERLIGAMKNAAISSDVLGSDHCPVLLSLEL